MVLATLAFLGYAVWTAHTPGQPRTLQDFLFIVGVFGVPFLVLAYGLWSLNGSTELATTGYAGESKRGRIALAGAVLSTASAALLLLMLPFWDSLIERERLGTLWVITGMLTAAIATLCGIIGSSKLRRPAVISVFLLPFWLFAAGLLVKGVMD